MPLHLEDVSLRDVTLEVTQQIEPMVRKKQLEFAIDVAARLPRRSTPIARRSSRFCSTSCRTP